MPDAETNLGARREETWSFASMKGRWAKQQSADLIHGWKSSEWDVNGIYMHLGGKKKKKRRLDVFYTSQQWGRRHTGGGGLVSPISLHCDLWGESRRAGPTASVDESKKGTN